MQWVDKGPHVTGRLSLPTTKAPLLKSPTAVSIFTKGELSALLIWMALNVSVSDRPLFSLHERYVRGGRMLFLRKV